MHPVIVPQLLSFFLFRYAAMCDCILVYTIAMPLCTCCLSVAHTCFRLSVIVVFSSFFFSKKLPIVVVRDVCPSVRPSVRLSVRLSVRPSVCPSVRLSSVEIISFRGNSLSNRPINLKIGLNVREGVVHVRKV